MKKVKFKNEKEVKLLKSIAKRYLIKHIDECELTGKIEEEKWKKIFGEEM